MDYEFEYVHDFGVDNFDEFGYSPTHLSQQRSQQSQKESEKEVNDNRVIVDEAPSPINIFADDMRTRAVSPIYNYEEALSEEWIGAEYIHDFGVDNLDGLSASLSQKSQPKVEVIRKQLEINFDEDQPEAEIINDQPKLEIVGEQKEDAKHRTPANAAPYVDVNAQFSMKILKTQGITPMPNYKSMQDVELNDHLDKFGIRPMGRKRAVEELTRIYEATHPIVDEATTPTRASIWTAISEFADKPRKKPPMSRKRPAPPEFDERTPPAEKPKSLQGLTGEVLRWLRMPQNDVLYKECLALKSITLERLLEAFAPLMREKSISKELLVRILDHLHITYSDSRGENNQYYH